MAIEVSKGFGGMVDAFKAKVKARKQKKAQNRMERHAEWRAAARPSQLATRFNTEAFRDGHAAIDWEKPLVICPTCQRFNCEAHGGEKTGDLVPRPDPAADSRPTEDPRPEDPTGGASWCP